MSSSCPHSRNPSSTPKFFKSTVFLVLSTIFILPILIHIAICLYDLVVGLNQNEIPILFKLADIFVDIKALGFSIPVVLKYNVKLTEIQGLNEIIGKRRYYGFKTFLYKSTVRKFLRSYFLAVCAIVINVVPLVIYGVTGKPKPDFQIFFYCKLFVSFLDNYIICVSILQCLFSSFIYLALLKRCFGRIETVMRKQHIILKLKESFIINEIVNVLPNEMALEENLLRLTYLYRSLVFNYRQLSIFMMPSILTWWLVSVIMLIIDFFILILFYFNDSYEDVDIIVRTCGSILGTVFFLKVSEEVTAVVSRFPIV